MCLDFKTTLWSLRLKFWRTTLSSALTLWKQGVSLKNTTKNWLSRLLSLQKDACHGEIAHLKRLTSRTKWSTNNCWIWVLTVPCSYQMAGASLASIWEQGPPKQLLYVHRCLFQVQPVTTGRINFLRRLGQTTNHRSVSICFITFEIQWNRWKALWQ